MTELSLGGQDIRQAGARTSHSGIFFDLVAGYSEPAAARGIDTVIPGAEGRTARNRVSDVRRIVLEGRVLGSSVSDWRTKTDTLMALCDPAHDPMDLIIADSYLGVGSTKTISVRVVNCVGGEPMYAIGTQFWSIELESVGADWA